MSILDDESGMVVRCKPPRKPKPQRTDPACRDWDLLESVSAPGSIIVVAKCRGVACDWCPASSNPGVCPACGTTINTHDVTSNLDTYTNMVRCVCGATLVICHDSWACGVSIPPGSLFISTKDDII